SRDYLLDDGLLVNLLLRLGAVHHIASTAAGGHDGHATDHDSCKTLLETTVHICEPCLRIWGSTGEPFFLPGSFQNKTGRNKRRDRFPGPATGRQVRAAAQSSSLSQPETWS